MDETTITFIVIMIIAIPACAWAGYRVGYFRGYVAARHLFAQSLVKSRVIWQHTGVSEPLSASKGEKE
jgi:hypothetical protein